jgi:hypothetical protein
MMSCDVYANNNEVACKAGGCKTIAAFPDVCLTPPSPPAGPIPVPYPDTSFSKDMQSGSKTVLIKGKEVMLKDQSFYKSSPLGNEPATRSLGASVITHVITGKTYFKAWSMDVQFEGANVPRHIDLMTSNHASEIGVGPMKTLGTASPSGEPEKPKCECCDQAPHTKAQEKGDPNRTMTEEEFYNPPPPGVPRGANAEPSDQAIEFQELKAKIEADGCEDILKTPPAPCNKFYVSEASDVGKSRGEFKAYKKTETFKTWQANQETQLQAATGDPSATCASIGHRTPLAAGGCPTKNENLSCVSAKCAGHENKLGILQGKIAQRHRSAPKAR